MKNVHCDYCNKEHGKPTASYCPEKTAAWSKGIGGGLPTINFADVVKMFRRIQFRREPPSTVTVDPEVEETLKIE